MKQIIIENPELKEKIYLKDVKEDQLIIVKQKGKIFGSIVKDSDDKYIVSSIGGCSTTYDNLSEIMTVAYDDCEFFVLD